MVFITHKVLNQLHSDTIACVLYELLVCRSLGFGIVYRDFPSRLRFHKFQYCSIFKVLLALLSDSSIIISKVVLFVKHFFRSISNVLNLDRFRFLRTDWNLSASIGSFLSLLSWDFGSHSFVSALGAQV